MSFVFPSIFSISWQPSSKVLDSLLGGQGFESHPLHCWVEPWSSRAALLSLSSIISYQSKGGDAPRLGR